MTTPEAVVVRIQLGILLRELRVQADITGADAAAHLGCSAAKISKVENGKQGIATEDVAGLLELYRASDTVLAEALKLTAVPQRRRSRRSTSYRDAVPNWFGRFLTLESEATVISTYENEQMPGLFQTTDYARAIMSAHDPLAGSNEVDRQLEVRLSRQAILTRTAPQPPQLDVLLHEAVLHRVIGDDAIMKAQLHHLIELSKLPNVQLQVRPFRSVPTPNMDQFFPAKTAFFLLKLPDRGTVLYIEDFGGATCPEDISVIQRHATAFQRLRAASLDPADSRKLVAKIAKEYR
jgi:transcriptional regulator with XRE-family HTH domain